jgi:hypothetical protein
VAFDKGDGAATASVRGGHLLAKDARAYVERGQPAWKDWLDSLAIPAV